MSRDEERADILVERRTGDDDLNEDELAFASQHEAACAACRRELSVWQALGANVAEGPMPATVDTQALTQQLRQKLAAETNDERQTVVPFARRAAYGAAFLALAASIALVVRSWRERPAALQVADVHVTLSSADASIDLKPAEAGAGVREGVALRAVGGPLCVAVEPGVRACLADGSEAVLADASLAHRRLDLKKGRMSASLDPQPAGTTFTVSTAAGSGTPGGPPSPLAGPDQPTHA